MKRNIMAVGAHADDIELNFGGTLFKYLDKGYEIVYVQSTNNMSGSKRRVEPDGSLSSTAYSPIETMQYRKAECDAAAKLFNTVPIHLDHPQRHYFAGEAPKKKSNRELKYGCELPEGVPENASTILTAYENPESINHLKNLILENNSEVIFTHGFAEKNLEHTATALLVAAAYWKATEAGYQGSLLHAVNRFDMLGKFNCQWETWTDITDFFDRKIAAVRKHVSQFPPDFTDIVPYRKEIAARRGKACGVDTAEIFNFINCVEHENQGELLRELLHNRAEGTRWSIS